MANELLSALETRISSAVDTIDALRGEVKELKAERQMLEDKLRELLDRMGIMDSSDDATAPAALATPDAAPTHHSDNVTSISRGSEEAAGPQESRFGAYGYGSSRSEY